MNLLSIIFDENKAHGQTSLHKTPETSGDLCGVYRTDRKKTLFLEL